MSLLSPLFFTLVIKQPHICYLSIYIFDSIIQYNFKHLCLTLY